MRPVEGPTTWTEQDRQAVNALRFLAADAVERAKSGHPGLPLGAAPMAYVLWARHLKHNPHDPAWPNRDRFVLSAGHGSALLYALLHLAGYDLPLDELKRFRQWGSRTPGHPEAGLTPGVEATTGPLGQGLAMAVGMAIAEAHLAARFNRPGCPVVDHRTYVLASDGDLMEGVSAEACALAGHLRLGKLVVLYDRNGISLAGSTGLAFTEDVGARFAAQGWHVAEVPDGEDLAAIDRALREATEARDRPSLLVISTTIGYGAPTKAGTFHAHGSPLGEEELRGAKRALGWPEEPTFLVPDGVRERLAEAAARGREEQERWHKLIQRYRVDHPELARDLLRRLRGELPPDWDADLPSFPPGEKGISTRRAAEAVLQRLAQTVPELVGGSADLNPSCLTWLKGQGDFGPPPGPADRQGEVGGGWSYGGRNVHFGVREHAMGAIAVGMARHGGVRPFTGTFLVFSDYMRPPIRLAALMHVPVVFAFTHDSIALGEDGPTHQPVEHLLSLRAIPNLTVIRPADAAETVEAWRAALLRRNGPTALVLTRQDLPVLDRSRLASPHGLHRGGYILWESAPGKDPELILLATGSEVHVALEAGEELARDGVRVRVVALPSWDLFDRQPRDYRDQILPPRVRARVAVEAGIRLGWEHYVGLDGEIVGLGSFGASAPGPVLLREFGITPPAVAAAGRRALARVAAQSGGDYHPPAGP
ncbi:MAG: transketolase [Candidatus Bipolaricaulota bacterium]|nr:transketolase [Candidatus Bipolaricaulota bacterium]